MNPDLYAFLCLLSAFAWGLFIFWPDSGVGRYSWIRLRLRRWLLASWRAQFQIIRRFFR